MNKALLKKHKWLLSVAAFLLLLLLLVGWQMIKSAGEFGRAKQSLQTVTTRLNQLNNRNPFPSQENTTRERENLAELLDTYNELNDRLREGQVSSRRMEAADFMTLLENTLRRLRAGFRASRVALPKDATFAFGFEKYAGGQLPEPESIPRMVQQLQVVEKLCQVIMESRIKELTNIVREEFELKNQPAAAPTRRGGRSAAPRAQQPTYSDARATELYEAQHFEVSLRGSEPAIVNCLNSLASMPMFTVVTSVELKNLRQATRNEPKKDDKTAGEKAPPDPKDRPVMIGREEVDAVIKMDVYQFAPSLPWQQ